MKDDIMKALQELVYVGQLGLTLATPVLMCLGLAYLLSSRLGFGIWIYFVGLFLGLAAGGMSFWNFYTKVVMKGRKRPDPKQHRPKSYSKHF